MNWNKPTQEYSMDLNALFDHLSSGKPVEGGVPAQVIRCIQEETV